DFSSVLRQITGMPNIITRPGWYIPERLVTPEKVYRNRRRFLREMGLAAGGLLAGIGCAQAEEDVSRAVGNAPAGESSAARVAKQYPFPRNPEFDPKIRITGEDYAAGYNNFYEFTTSKTRVKRLTDKFVISPWEVEIGGLCEKPMKVSVDELVASMPMEERVYRFRCVEAWSMIVPWTGFPLSKL